DHREARDLDLSDQAEGAGALAEVGAAAVDPADDAQPVLGVADEDHLPTGTVSEDSLPPRRTQAPAHRFEPVARASCNTSLAVRLAATPVGAGATPSPRARRSRRGHRAARPPCHGGEPDRCSSPWPWPTGRSSPCPPWPGGCRRTRSPWPWP